MEACSAWGKERWACVRAALDADPRCIVVLRDVDAARSSEPLPLFTSLGPLFHCWTPFFLSSVSARLLLLFLSLLLSVHIDLPSSLCFQSNQGMPC